MYVGKLSPIYTLPGNKHLEGHFDEAHGEIQLKVGSTSKAVTYVSTECIT
jgi:hypothetical protein